MAVKREKILAPVIFILALGIIASGLFLQWRLTHVVVHPQAVAFLGVEKHLVNSLQAAAVGLLNLQDDTLAGEQLEEMYEAFEQWTSNHYKLVSIADEPGLNQDIVQELKNHVFPRYDNIVASYNEIFEMSQEQPVMSLSELKPLVREVEQGAEIYLFFLDHFDLKLANLAREKIESLPFVEGALIVGGGILSLFVLLGLFFPASKTLGTYSVKLKEWENADQQKNEFLAVLGHELRNPLAAISGGIQVLKMRPDKTKEMIKAMDKNVQLISALLDDMLDLTRISRGKISLHTKTLDLKEAIEGALKNIEPAIRKKKQKLESILPEDPLWINADPMRIEQIIMNLLTNARKYTPEGGRIKITAIEEDGEALIAVKDNGIGINPEMLDEIFKPFVRTRKTIGSGSSLGIGLALVKRLTELHGGMVKAYSKGEGKGSEFTLRLPLAEPVSAPRPLEESREADDELIKDLRVMLVDDNPYVLKSTEIILNQKGCVTRKALSAKEAIEAAKTFKASAFLLDIGMPDMNGYELCHYLRAHGYKDALIIAVSGYGHEDARRMSKEAGIDYHFNKPLNYPALIKTLAARSTNKKQISV